MYNFFRTNTNKSGYKKEKRLAELVQHIYIATCEQNA